MITASLVAPEPFDAVGPEDVDGTERWARSRRAEIVMLTRDLLAAIARAEESERLVTVAVDVAAPLLDVIDDAFISAMADAEHAIASALAEAETTISASARLVGDAGRRPSSLVDSYRPIAPPPAAAELWQPISDSGRVVPSPLVERVISEEPSSALSDSDSFDEFWGAMEFQRPLRERLLRRSHRSEEDA
jgi:hypothetical protein